MDQNKNMEEQEVLIYTLTDEDGNESDFELLAEYAEDDQRYMALIPADAADDEEVEYVILKEVVEDGEKTYVTIDDEAEFDHIANMFDDMLSEVDYDE